MDEQFLAKFSSKMLQAVDFLRQDLASIRTGRASSLLVENIVLPVYQGTQKMKLKELATITVVDARTLVISPYDVSILEEIVKGLLALNLGFNPITAGKVIRIIIPPLTQERREEFLKLARSKAEGGRIMIRQARHEAMNHLKKQQEAGQLTEDDRKRLEKEVQKITDQMVEQINSLLQRKEEELTTL